MKSRTSALPLLIVICLGTAGLRGAVSYIGDDPSSGQAITSGAAGPDGANGGNITYAFITGSYSNSSGVPLELEIVEVNFWSNAAGTLIPFVATYNGAGVGNGSNFTVVAVGDPIAGTTGLNNAAFEVGGVTPLVTVPDGESLVAGFHQSTGMVPWDEGSADYMKDSNVIPAAGGSLPAPNWSTLGRGYKFNVGVELRSDPLAPTDIGLSNSELLPSSPVPTEVGTLNTSDPNLGDNVFLYQLVSGAGDTDNALFAIAGPRLETVAALGGAGTSYSIRVRSTDPGALSFEKSFTILVVAGEAPTALSLSATIVSGDSPPNTTVGNFETSDPDPADVHTYTLVPGPGDADNAAFSINGDQLRTAQVLPPGGASLSIRVRTRDLGSLSIEEAFTIMVVYPSVRISEFMANNSASLLDEDGESSDWIEIFNEQSEEVNLAGWYLTDDANDLTKWQFPSRVLAGGSRLVVFASNKDRAGANDPELHTNFKLTSSGEFLALVKPDGQSIASAFSPTYPPQTTDISYGASPDGSVEGFLSPSSPGAANGTPSPSGINTAEFSVGRGFFDAPFDLTLTPTIPGSTIRYTLNGSKPTTSSGTIYSRPINIADTTTLRALSYNPGGGRPQSVIATHTYLFVDDVITQGVMSTSITQHPRWGTGMRSSLLDLPTVSLVKSGSVSTSESETSMELIFPDGTTGFQVDCGVEHFGGHSLGSPKKNMRMSFKKVYGPSRLNYDLYEGEAARDFDQIILRTGSHDTWFWTHPSGHGGIFIRGRWAFDRQLEAGHVAPRGRWVHVYLNGTYHGMHHLMERPNAAFMASYLGGEKEDYEALNAGSPIDGDKSTWNAMKAVLSDYEQLETYMDVTNYADYMLLQFYGGNDWDWNTSQNWSSASHKAPGAAYKFFAWDSDVMIRTTLNANVVNRGGPENLWNTVKNHDEFKLLLADRAQKFFYNDGMLTRDRVLGQLDELAERIDRAIIAETARWGGGGYTPITWENEINKVKNDLVDQRTGVVISQLRSAGMFPSFDAPLFSQFGGQVPANYQLTLSLAGNAGGGQIYYTLDGSDPIGEALPPGSTETILLDQGVAARALIPSVANGGASLGDSWKGGAEPFDDSSWQAGTNGIGYDTTSNYDSLIGLDVLAMQGVNSSAFARIAFNLTPQELADIDQLRLDMKAEDGFVAYLNGVEVTSLEKPSQLNWDSISENATRDADALQFRPHNITPHLGELVVGTNILAFHLLNQSEGSSDLLCLPRLVGIMVPQGQGGNPGGQLYTGPISLVESGMVRARVQLGGQWSALDEAFFYVDASAPVPGDIVIAEINYNPQGADDAEFLELRNLSAKNLILDGLEFTDGIQFTFPANTVLAPGGQIVVVGNESVFFGRYLDSSSPWFASPVMVAGTFTGALDNAGEILQLQDAGGSALLNFPYHDSGSWPGRADGKGSSTELENLAAVPSTQPELDAYLANGERWRPSSEFHGSPGRDGSGPDNRVVFNELLSNPGLVALDWFELYNTTVSTVDLGGWFISDDSSEYKKFEIPALTLEGGKVLFYDESDFNSGGNLVDFALAGAKGDDLYLLEADPFGNLVRFVDRIEFGAAVSGESFGRWPDGSGDLYPMRSQTPGYLNSTAGNSVRVGSVIVSEVMYNPLGAPDDGLEFIEICNAGAFAETLINWRLRGEAEFDFAAENLAPGELLLIVDFDPLVEIAARNSFLAAYPSAAASQLRGPWSAGAGNLLDNGGAAIRLQRAGALENPPGEAPFYPALFEDAVNFNDTAPWPTGPDGTGPSLSRISASIYGDDPGNWQLAPASPGIHLGGLTTYEFWTAVYALGVGPDADRLADFEIDGIVNLLEFALGADPTVIDLDKLPLASAQSLTILGQTDDYLTLTYRKRRDAPHLIYLVEVSEDLVNWQATTLQVGAPVDNGDGTDSVTFRDDQPIGASTRHFLRLVVSDL
jgi:hypothetical protein